MAKGKRKILERSKSIARLYGGDLALRRLDEDHVAHALPYTLERSDLVLKGLLEEEHLDLKKLQVWFNFLLVMHYYYCYSLCIVDENFSFNLMIYIFIMSNGPYKNIFRLIVFIYLAFF